MDCSLGRRGNSGTGVKQQGGIYGCNQAVLELSVYLKMTDTSDLPASTS